jgi:hypothetical protein
MLTCAPTDQNEKIVPVRTEPGTTKIYPAHCPQAEQAIFSKYPSLAGAYCAALSPAWERYSGEGRPEGFPDLAREVAFVTTGSSSSWRVACHIA